MENAKKRKKRKRVKFVKILKERCGGGDCQKLP